jgi:hypothetical protein
MKHSVTYHRAFIIAIEACSMNTLIDPSASLTPTRTPSHNDLYPPSFAEVTRTFISEYLSNHHPDLAIDIDATWLYCRDSRVAPHLPNPPTIHALRDSVVDYFTGALNWTETEVQGLYTSPVLRPNEETIKGIGRVELINLYASAQQTLESRFISALDHYWNKVLAVGKPRRATFIEQRVRALELEAQMRVNEGDMPSDMYYMLERMLKGCAQATQAPVPEHGVYSVSLVWKGGLPMPLAGAFVLTSVRGLNAPSSDNQSLGKALLYTIDEGLQGFQSLKQQTHALDQRLLTADSKASLLSALDHKDRSKLPVSLDADNPASSLQWHYTPLGPDFLNPLFTQQLEWQKSHFEHAVLLGKSLEMDHRSFERLIPQLLAPKVHLDNHKHLQRHDSALIQTHLPDWWQSMNQQQRSNWLNHAQTLGEQTLNIHRQCSARFKGEAFNPDTFVRRYIDQHLATALKKLAVTLPPEKISLTLCYPPPLPRPSLTLSLPPRAEVLKRYSLKTLMHLPVESLNLGFASAIIATDERGAAVPGIDHKFVQTLVSEVSIPEAFDTFLKAQLMTSPFAQQLRKAHELMMHAQLRMALLEVEHQAFPLWARQWLEAVLDSPNPATRSKVGSDDIQVHFLKISHTRLSNILVVAPTGKLDSGPVVLCTFGAPDGVVLRWFDSVHRLKSMFMEQAKFRPYLAHQIPASVRADTLGVLEYDKWLKHWRLPDVMRYMTQPLPVPEMLFRPVTFVPQQKSFYDENHEIKIDHLIKDANATLKTMTSTSDAISFEMVASIALLFLPPPILLPLALGLGFYSAWNGFSQYDADDFEGATGEFLNALGYLATAQISASISSGSLTPIDQSFQPVEEQTPRPHLVRTVGRDGKPQIGYLLSPKTPPRLPTESISVTPDPQRFTAIDFNSERCYVRRRFNLFGHARLYRLNAADNTLMHANEYVSRNSKGIWVAAGGLAPRLSLTARNAASAELDEIIAGWPQTPRLSGAEEKSTFVTRYTVLSRTSNTQELPEILAYSEGGSAHINDVLRRGTLDAQTLNFLAQFYQLNEYEGVAFRATYVSKVGLETLQRQIGEVFADSGVQSASISRGNASRWSQDSFVTRHASAEKTPMFFIFDRSINKKNMFSNFLGDHVAVPPATPMQLRAIRQVEERWYAYFSAPSSVADDVYDLYSGEKKLMLGAA